MRQRITEIIEELKDILEHEALVVSHNVLFSEAVSCYRGEQVWNNKEQKKATEKQINYAKALSKESGIKIELKGNETVFEISKLIKELQKNVKPKDKKN